MTWTLLSRKFSKAPLATDTVDYHFIKPIRKWLNDNIEDQTPNPLVVLGSGVWDLLGDGSNREGRISSQQCCQHDPQFVDHKLSLMALLAFFISEFPRVSIAWKSMTAVYIHKVSCGGNDACHNRTKNMSSSRALKLYRTQKQVISQMRPDAHVIELYDLSFKHAENTKQSDGRHYLCNENVNMCELMWNWSFVID